MENKISIAIPEEVKNEALKLAEELNQLLSPYLIALTAGQRKTMPKMGDKSLAFVEKAISYCELKPDFAPRYLNIQELKKDFNALTTLTTLNHLLRPLAENLSDTMSLCGSESYIASLTYYNSVKEAARRDTPDAKAIVDDLKVRFTAISTSKAKE